MTNLERQLVDKAKRGSKLALAELVKRHEKKLWTFLARIATTAEADELFQETWKRAILGLASWKGQGEFGSWILAIGRNVASDHLRQQRLSSLCEEPHGTHQNQVEVEENCSHIIRLLNNLSPRQKEALVLRYLEGMAFREVANVMAVESATARKYVQEGIMKIRSLLSNSDLER